MRDQNRGLHLALSSSALTTTAKRVDDPCEATDIPFFQDGFRDGEPIWNWMHSRFAAQLEVSLRTIQRPNWCSSEERASKGWQQRNSPLKDSSTHPRRKM